MHAHEQRPATRRNRLPGRITAIHDRGATVEIEVAVADACVHVPCTPQYIARRGWRVGQHVWLLVPGAATVLLT